MPPIDLEMKVEKANKKSIALFVLLKGLYTFAIAHKIKAISKKREAITVE